MPFCRRRRFMTQPPNVANPKDRSEVHILGLSGSTRKGSFNTALLYDVEDMLPENTTLEIHDLSALPLFSQELERDLTAPIRTFKQKYEKQTRYFSPHQNTTTPSQP